jgi:hypothetical protein
MVSIDILGIILSALFIGIRYPHIAFIAILTHEAGKIFMAILVHKQVNFIIAAGAFGTASFADVGNESGILVMFSGALANFILASMIGGLEYEKTAHLFNPLISLRAPWTVINLRLALLSAVITIWNFV